MNAYYIYSLDSKLLAEYQPPPIAKYYYYTSDQINSTWIVTDDVGTVVYSAAFDPYGGTQKIWQNTYDPKMKFSGKEREPSTDIDYFGARYYDHLKYRFLSVDPVISKEDALSNPQLWNLYSYCRNNPITRVDPDGRWDEANHDISIREAFNPDFRKQFGLSNDDVETIVNSNNFFDKIMQGNGKNFNHAMRDEGQSIAEAKRYRDQTANTLIGRITKSREDRFKNGDNKQWSEQELAWFGELQHSYVDETCPSHQWKEFKGLSASHIFGDINMNTSQKMENVRIIQNKFKELSK